MKKHISILAVIVVFSVLLLPRHALTQSPEKMSYQAVIRDFTNTLITNQTIGMQISILQGSPNGIPVYVEHHNPLTNANGLVSLEIGTGTIVSGSFSSIDWASGPYLIKTETDPNGGNNYSITGVSQLLSVPYAMYAKTAGSVAGAPEPERYIGEYYGGGVIFHLWTNDGGEQHGLIVDIVDLSSTYLWSNVFDVPIGDAARSSWDGSGNSQAIVTQPGHTVSAAALCLNSTNGGYDDWYLPSIDELSLLWHNRFNVHKSLGSIPGATLMNIQGNLWSSTEDYATNAYYFNSQNGSSGTSLKHYTLYVRAIRAF